MNARTAVAIGCVALAPSGPAPAQPPIADVVADWTRVDAPATRIRIEDGVLRVDGGGGWFRSERRYADFRLTAELRFLSEDTDSGIFVRADGDTRFGPGWPASSYQVQLRNPLGESRFPPVGGLFRHGRQGGETRFDEAAARAAFTGTGEWQTVVVRLAGETLSVELNGTSVTEADGIVNPSGFVGVQSEAGTLEVRSLVIETD